MALVIAFLVIAVGTRDLFFGTLPLVGQLAPLPSWSTSWHHFFSGWQSAGVGTTAPASPAFGLIGLSGTVFFGAMGTLQRVLLLGCIPLGAWGVSRCLRPLVSPRARVVAVICYLGLPLPYGALGLGRWDGLVAYAAFPFIALRLARAAGVAPYAVEPGPHWRSRPAGQVVMLGAVIAAASGFAPAVRPHGPRHGGGLGAGVVLVGARGPTWRVLVVAVQAVVVALVLALPWVVGTALAGKGSVAIFGLPLSGATAPSWGDVIRFAVGPAARSPLAWLLVVGAALPLVIARGTRLAWAARLWVMALASWGIAYATSRGELGSFTPSETVVLAPAALAVAACVGIGIAAFENDLSGREFGWRQLVGVAALVFVAVGLLPVLGGAVGGRWDLPSQGVEQPLAFLARPSTGVARVLWLGDPRALPAGGWSVESGLAYALTPQELPDAAQVFAPAGPGPADEVAKAVRLAAAGGTVHLGRLLAPAGVRYVVVVDALAPSLVGSSPASVERAAAGRPQRRPAPAGRPAGGAGRARRPGLRERGEHAGHRHARHRRCRCRRRPTRARRTWWAGSRCSARCRTVGRPPVRCRRAPSTPATPRPGSFTADGGRAHGGAAACVRLGGAVRGQCQGRGHALALAVPPCPAGGPPRAGRVGAAGTGADRPAPRRACSSTVTSARPASTETVIISETVTL